MTTAKIPVRESISAARLRQEIAGFHDRSEELMRDINALMRAKSLGTGTLAQLQYAARTLHRVRTSLDAALQLLSINNSKGAVQ